MIRLNVTLLIEDSDRRKPLLDVATELVELSLHDKGCIEYDLYASTTADDRYMIYETWESEADLKRHMESEHFKRLVPKLEEIATMTLERFDF